MKLTIYLNKDLQSKINLFAKRMHISKATFVRLILQCTDWDTLANSLDVPLKLLDEAIDNGQMTIDEVLGSMKGLNYGKGNK